MLYLFFFALFGGVSASVPDIPDFSGLYNTMVDFNPEATGNVTRDPVWAGYDIVAYYSLSPRDKGVKGNSKYQTEWSGSTWQFSTQANLDKFKASPEDFAPQYGGYCAWGICCELPPKWPWSKTHLGPPAGPSDGWKIYNGKLYTAINGQYINRFFQDASRNIQAGDKRWSGWFGKPNSPPFNNRCYAWNYQECM